MTMSYRTPRRPLASFAIGMPAVVLTLFVLGGCARLDHLWHRGDRAPPAPVIAPPPPPPAAPVEPPVAVRPLGSIINDDLQHGHYTEGEAALRAYLAEHPKDRLAQSMLRQLTADPLRTLGPVGGSHVVQPGESYSTLAKRYLGNAQLFLILARYNHAAKPAMLRVGEKLQLPASGRVASDAAAPDSSASTSAASAARSSAESPAARSQRLQRESLQLLGAGHETQALARLDAALATDPGLASDRDGAQALRQRVVASCHQRAIVLYRDQKLESAIALWDRVLAVEPSYEPALAYRARAQELQRRLKQL